MPLCEELIVWSSKLNQRWGEGSVNSSRWKGHKTTSLSYANFIRIGNICLGIHFCSSSYCLWGWETEPCLYTYGYGWLLNFHVCYTLAGPFCVTSQIDRRYFAFITHSSFTSFIYWFSFPPFILVKVSSWIFGNTKKNSLLCYLKKKYPYLCLLQHIHLSASGFLPLKFQRTRHVLSGEEKTKGSHDECP